LPSFGVEGTPIEFFAKAALWEEAKYEVTVYWIGECDSECGGARSEVWAITIPIWILVPILILILLLVCKVLVDVLS
jgi:hypothetical protein